MFDIFMDKLKEIFKSRLFPVTIVYALLISALLYRLFYLQIVKGEEYDTTVTETSSTERVIQATRGNIYDSKGVLLAYNVLSYNVTFLDTGEYTDSETLNEKIAKIIELIENNGDEVDIDFGLSIDDEGNVTFTSSKETEILKFKRDVYSHAKLDELTDEEKAATAEDVFTYLQTATSSTSLKFNISTDYSKQEVYKIMAIRYAMYLNSYTKYDPLVIATDVTENTIAAVKEYSGDISGLDISSTSTRKYNEEYAECLAHVLGYTGTISEEAYAEKEESGDTAYSEDDQVGKTGVEAQFDAELHGTNGVEVVTLNQNKRVVSVTETTAAVSGQDITLSIDAELQKATYELLENELAGIILENLTSSTNSVSSDDDILIPIYDVYNALLSNSIIDITHFTADDATDVEQAVYSTFKSKRKKVFSDLKSILDYSDGTVYNKLSEDEQGYMDYIYKMLVNNGVLLSSTIKEADDDEYNDYVDGKISLSEFLQYALSQDDWVDRTVFSDADSFYDSEEIYNTLLDYIIDQLTDDSDFSSMVYKVLIYNGSISANQICLLLFDQNVLEYDKDDYTSLKNGNSYTAYTFMRKKIKKLEITPGQLGLDPCSGSVVITDPDTGKVQALVSYPGYDNNKLANKIDSTYYSYLTGSSSYPLINRAIQQKTAPGSTFKMLSAIIALEELNWSPTTTYIDDTGQFPVGGTTAPKCWKKTGHGSINVTQALEVSCNVFFYTVGYDAGSTTGTIKGDLVESKSISILQEYASQFGFGALSGVELPNEAVGTISDSQAIRSYIGQGTNNYTPISIAKYITGLANNGTVYDLSIIKDTDPVVDNEVEASQSTWDAIRKGNYLVVNGSSSSISEYFEDLDVKVAGKTGTAQENLNRPDHGLFVSYAPYDDPEITVTCVIPNGYTSHNAAELASNIYKYYFADDEEKEELLENGVEKQATSNTQTD